MDNDKKKLRLSFDGTGNVKVFLTKLELEASIKGHVEEKKAQFLASKLMGPAFDVYLRLSDDEKKDFAAIKPELLREFEKGQLNREEAIITLSDQRRKSDESALTFAYRIKELVKLAYPDFNEATCKTIAKDYFMRGLHPEMQTAIKASEKFETGDIGALATEAVRLELAGIKSYKSKSSTASKMEGCNAVVDTNEAVINSIIDKVVEKMQHTSVNVVSDASCKVKDSTKPNDEEDGASINFTRRSNQGYNRYSSRGDSRGGRYYRNYYRGGSRSQSNKARKCRACESTEHIIKDCPLRFCQACGNRGHDQYNEKCPKFQS